MDSQPVADDVSLPEGAGKLVRDILETRKDLEKAEDGAGLGRTLSMNGKTDSVEKEEVGSGVPLLKDGLLNLLRRLGNLS